MPEYTAIIDYGNGGDVRFAARNQGEARAKARALARSGDWSDCFSEEARTIWIDLELRNRWGRTVAKWHNLSIDPPEPDCAHDDGHAWNEGQVYGQGGGVAWTDTCSFCGLQRHHDTWAQNRETGEQGLHSVEYISP